MLQPTRKLICKLPSCKYEDTYGNCTSHHHSDSCFEQPTTNNLEGWEEEFDERFSESKYYKSLKQFISDLRKHDELELIKMFKEQGYKSPNVEGIIKYHYYNK